MNSPQGSTARNHALNRDSIFPILVAGLIVARDGIGFAVAVATLLFTGPLQDGLAMGAGASWLCTVILAVLI